MEVREKERWGGGGVEGWKVGSGRMLREGWGADWKLGKGVE